MDEQRNRDTTAGIRLCRVCKTQFVGHGALCEKHRAEVASQIAQANAEASAVLDAHIAAQQAERRARRRSEWHEPV